MVIYTKHYSQIHRYVIVFISYHESTTVETVSVITSSVRTVTWIRAHFIVVLPKLYKNACISNSDTSPLVITLLITKINLVYQFQYSKVF